MSRRIKEVAPVQRIKVSAREMTKDLMGALIRSWPGPHPLLRLITPIRNIPSTVGGDFEFTLVSYESTTDFKAGETAGEYRQDVDPELNRESKLARVKQRVQTCRTEKYAPQLAILSDSWYI